MRQPIAASTLPLFLLAALPLAACGSSDPPPTTGALGRQVADVPPEPITDLDILFVIDNSWSMMLHQQALILAARDSLFGQLDAELGVLPNLQIGVVTSSMGAGPYPINGCIDTNGEVGGQLFVLPECGGIVDGKFLSDVAGPDGTRITNYEGELADAFACIANVGNEGCGFEQPFSAMQHALDGSVAGNEGFLRPDAMLLVVFVTDEDDCSAFDTSLFDPDSEEFGPLASFRCFSEGIVCDGDDPNTPGIKTNCHSREDSAYVSPVAGYIDFLNGVKGDPTKVMVTGLFGKPDHVEVLPDVENDIMTLASVCAVAADGGGAWPAPRMQELVESFPARYDLGNLCDAIPGQLSNIASTAAKVMSGAPCLLGPIPDSDRAAAGQQSSCRAYDVTDPRKATEQRVEIPACASNGGAAPCFDLVADAQQCGGTATGLSVVRQGARPAGTHLVVECAEAAPL
jgi:hypothetical protein